MNVVFFDYDDTILPSSCIQSLVRTINDPGDDWWKQLPSVEKVFGSGEQWLEYQEAICRHFLLWHQDREVIVISNGEYQWIMKTCELYLPQLHHFWKQNHTVILSAPDLFPNLIKRGLHLAKAELMRRCVHSFDAKTVISFGDSMIDRQALLDVAKHFPSRKYISVKLRDLPDPFHLQQQNNHLWLTSKRWKREVLEQEETVTFLDYVYMDFEFTGSATFSDEPDSPRLGGVAAASYHTSPAPVPLEFCEYVP